jgi:hypothetical protein
LKADIRSGRLEITGVQLIGTYPITGPDDGDVDVVQASSNDDVLGSWPAPQAFSAPSAERCNAPTRSRRLRPQRYRRSRNRSRISPRSNTRRSSPRRASSPDARALLQRSKLRTTTNVADDQEVDQRREAPVRITPSPTVTEGAVFGLPKMPDAA